MRYYKRTKKNTVVNNGLSSAMGLDHFSESMIPFEMFKNSTPAIISYNWVQLSEIYKNNGFVKLAVDLPVADCFRNGGYELDSSTLNAEELAELNEKIHTKDDNIIKQCMRWSRLYGGGSIVANVNQPTESKLNPETLYNKELNFVACDRWQCYPEGNSLYMADKFYLVNLSVQSGSHTGDIIVLDKSRVKPFIGEIPPYFLRCQTQGWGLSILEQIIPQLNQYLKAQTVILELLDEAKIDILKIFGLSDLLMSGQGEQAVRRRVQIFAEQKNFKSVGAMDSQDDYVQKTMTFAGLNDLLERIFLLICSSLRIPYSKVFGRGASGFSNGEDDLENYNAMIMSELRQPAEDVIKWVGQLRCYQLFGRKVEDLTIKWKPLRVLSDEQQQTVNNSKVNSYVQLYNIGVMNRKQVAEQLTKDEIILFSDEEIKEIEKDMKAEKQEPQAEKQSGMNLMKMFKK